MWCKHCHWWRGMTISVTSKIRDKDKRKTVDANGKVVIPVLGVYIMTCDKCHTPLATGVIPLMTLTFNGDPASEVEIQSEYSEYGDGASTTVANALKEYNKEKGIDKIIKQHEYTKQEIIDMAPRRENIKPKYLKKELTEEEE